jgi:hypothetical protein
MSIPYPSERNDQLDRPVGIRFLRPYFKRTATPAKATAVNAMREATRVMVGLFGNSRRSWGEPFARTPGRSPRRACSFGQLDQLPFGNDVVDPVEGSVARALEHLAQYRVGGLVRFIRTTFAVNGNRSAS